MSEQVPSNERVAWALAQRKMGYGKHFVGPDVAAIWELSDEIERLTAAAEAARESELTACQLVADRNIEINDLRAELAHLIQGAEDYEQCPESYVARAKRALGPADETEAGHE
jgi:hypothetical protein